VVQLSQKLGMNPTMGPAKSRSTVFSAARKAVAVAFRRQKLRPLDDCLYASQPSIPHLIGSALHPRVQRHGLARLPDAEGDKQVWQRCKLYHQALQ
jgi:hypothetical protein